MATRDKARLRAPFGIVAILCFIFLIAPALVSGLDFGEVRELVRVGVPEQAIINVVRQGVSFQLGMDQEAELRSLGASDALIVAVRETSAPQPVLGDGSGEFLTMEDLDPAAASIYADPGITTYYAPEVIVESPTVIYDSGYYSPNYYYYDYYPGYSWGGSYWGGGYYRPSRPGHRPPRPPSSRPPPSRPGGSRPPGRPGAGRPPGSRPSGVRPPSPRPPGNRSPGGSGSQIRPPGRKSLDGRSGGGTMPSGRPNAGGRQWQRK